MVPIEFGKENKAAGFLDKFPFGKVPAMEAPEGPLYEGNAIAYYIASKGRALLGSTDYERALVQQFICSLNCELTPAVAAVICVALGYLPYEEEQWKQAGNTLITKLTVYDSILQSRTYLVGDFITLADILMACTLEPVYGLFLEANDRENLINLTRWFLTMINHDNFKATLNTFALCKRRLSPSNASYQ